jgi:hypothetical protein
MAMASVANCGVFVNWILMQKLCHIDTIVTSLACANHCEIYSVSNALTVDGLAFDAAGGAG